MLTFIRSQFRHRWSRAGALGAGILIAAVSFVLLTSASRSADLRVRGSVESNYRNAYDILVRPSGSFAQLERSRGLIRDNYLSGIFGGITLSQYERIKRIRGVKVAAPIGNIGYVLPAFKRGVRINELLTENPVQLYRIRTGWLANNRTSRYPGSETYVYYTRRNRFVSSDNGPLGEIVPNRREPLPVCSGINYSRPIPQSPFDYRARKYLSCYSARSPETAGRQIAQFYRVLPPDAIGALTEAYFPILVAAIDPVQEARLLRVDKAILSGRYLRETDGPRIRRRADGGGYRTVPVIASTKSYVDERLLLTIERLQPPADSDLPATLASRQAFQFLADLPGRVIQRREMSVRPFYEGLLRGGRIYSFAYWTTGEVEYRTGDGRLVPVPTMNPLSIWKTPFQASEGGYWPAPGANADLQFRRLRAFAGGNVFGAGDILRTSELQIVGRYDPAKLPGFSPLSQVPLETYYPPALQPADDASRKALGGRPLLPTQNLGDYIAQPPLLLTTLEGMKPFLNPVFFGGSKGRAEAPISVIRVRVADVTGPDELSRERVRAVALEIRQQTGLDVDITVGSSPRELLVQLPEGRFGRPRLLLEEGWAQKGVSVAYLNAVDRKSVALSALILLICAVFVANGALAAVQARRREIGTLLCLGWPRQAVFAVLLGELALIGLIAGALGSGAAALIAVAFSLELSLAQTLLVMPVALLVALVAGLAPALSAAATPPLHAILPPVRDARSGRTVRSLSGVALVNLRRRPARTLVATAGLVVGGAALTVLLAINRAFEGTLVGTLLGDAILLQVRGTDFISVVLTMGLAAVSVADVVFLGLRERAPELVTLRAAGWSDQHVRRLVVTEAIGFGVLGGVGGAVVGSVIGGLLLGMPAGALAIAAVLAALGGILLAMLACLLPLSRIEQLTLPAVLAAE